MRRNECDYPAISALIFRREIGRLCRSASQNIIDYRIETLTASKFRVIVPIIENNAVISAMEFDKVENRFLLCGSSKGVVSVVDFDKNSCDPIKHCYQQIVAMPKSNHKFWITNCQWYPVDSGLFITASMDKTVKLWDSNRLCAIDKFELTSPITQMHWGICGSSRNASLIAVAISSSNVHFLDPRTGNSIQHLRCKGERINSVRWKKVSEFHLFTGSESGNVALWDIRSGRSELARLKTEQSLTKKRKLNEPFDAAHTSSVICIKDTEDGEKILTMSHNKTLKCWDSKTLKFECFVNVDYKRTLANTSLFFDTCNEGSLLWAFVPTDNNIAVQKLSRSVHKITEPKKLLQGHFHSVSALAYRQQSQQLVTSSVDRLTLVWVPNMDERRPENEEMLSRFYEDAYSDDEFN